jgi:hypothetical protein
MDVNMTWKQHPIFINYEISTEGLVRNIKTKKILTFYITPHGYLRKQLRLNKRSLNASLHVLVLETFIGFRPKNHQTNHIDGNKLNNKLSNLEWVLPIENVAHSYKLGLSKNFGSNHTRSKLTESQAVEIKRKLKEGMNTYDVIRYFNNEITYSVIHNIKLGKTWKHLNLRRLVR